MRDGVTDNKFYYEHELRLVERAKQKSYKTNAVKDPQESVENVAVVAGSLATPNKEEEANTADNDISPQQAPTVATPSPPIPLLTFLHDACSAVGTLNKNDEFARVEKLSLDQKAEQEAREAAAHDTLDHHDPWHPEASNADAQPGGESVSTNEKTVEMSDRQEVTAEESYYQRTAIEDSAYGTASHGQFSGVKVALPTDSIAVDQQIDDTSTEYSETSTTESSNHGYMEYLADDLYAVASKVQCDPQSIQTLSGLLPELLQQFALRIGQEVSRKDGREVMCYVHKHRK